jgi:sugar/nucleoside kinase (ribokinase family)
MKIVLDRRSCNCWEAACETHFGWHFLRDEITPVDCTLQVVDDGQPERVFLILDRDGVDKTLVVDDANWADAYDSWRLAWEQQQSARSE